MAISKVIQLLLLLITPLVRALDKFDNDVAFHEYVLWPPSVSCPSSFVGDTFDCSVFYECRDTVFGAQLIRQRCEKGNIFDPINLECVKQHRSRLERRKCRVRRRGPLGLWRPITRPAPTISSKPGTLRPGLREESRRGGLRTAEPSRRAQRKRSKSTTTTSTSTPQRTSTTRSRPRRTTRKSLELKKVVPAISFRELTASFTRRFDNALDGLNDHDGEESENSRPEVMQKDSHAEDTSFSDHHFVLGSGNHHSEGSVNAINEDDYNEVESVLRREVKSLFRFVSNGKFDVRSLRVIKDRNDFTYS